MPLRLIEIYDAINYIEDAINITQEPQCSNSRLKFGNGIDGAKLSTSSNPNVIQ